MQHTVILALASMLTVVAVALVFLLWRAYRRSAWRQRWQAVGTMGWTRASSGSSDPPAAPPAHPPAPVLPLSGKDESSGRRQADEARDAVARRNHAPRDVAMKFMQ